MSRESSHAALAKEVERFESDLRKLAIELVRAVFLRELERRMEPKATRPRVARRRRQAAHQARNLARTRKSQPSVLAVGSHPTRGEPAEELPSAGDVAAATASSNSDPVPLGRVDHREARSRATDDGHRWTRESVIKALGEWLFSGEPAEAAFIKRHGPKGLVPAATKLFGRFDAALNAANLAIAGRVGAVRAMARRAQREQLPTMRELARRQQERRRAAAATP